MKPHNPDHEHALKTLGVPQDVLNDAKAHGINLSGCSRSSAR
jgi:post-segregation antitoxin (ccd killing protein)